MRTLLFTLTLLLFAAPALAEDESAEAAPAAPTATPGAATEAGPQSPPAAEAGAPARVDALTDRLQQIVRGYYSAIGHTADQAELDAGVTAIQALLLSGVPLPEIERAAVSAGATAATMGPSPFAIAVSAALRGPSWSAPTAESPPPAAKAPPDPQREARIAAAKAARERQQNYRKWKRLLQPQRTLLTVGLPLFLGAKVGGFTGAIVHRGTVGLSGASTFVSAIPVVGNVIYAAGAESPVHMFFGLAEISGFALALTALILPVEWPFDGDPTAANVRRPPPIALVPTGSGAVVMGTF